MVEVTWHYARHNGRNKDSLRHALPEVETRVYMDASREEETLAGWWQSAPEERLTGVALCGRFVRLDWDAGFDPETCIDCARALRYLNTPR